MLFIEKLRLPGGAARRVYNEQVSAKGIGLHSSNIGPQRFLLASTRVCHPLPTLTGEDGSELASLLPEGHDCELYCPNLTHRSQEEAVPTP
ncbi:hypothetical protein J6590_044965 [Homalodisca vitripennis]|nr:hypothetical protein J6590_044965 [Homalodisca vitripennis]